MRTRYKRLAEAMAGLVHGFRAAARPRAYGSVDEGPGENGLE